MDFFIVIVLIVIRIWIYTHTYLHICIYIYIGIHPQCLRWMRGCTRWLMLQPIYINFITRALKMSLPMHISLKTCILVTALTSLVCII